MNAFTIMPFASHINSMKIAIVYHTTLPSIFIPVNPTLHATHKKPLCSETTNGPSHCLPRVPSSFENLDIRVGVTIPTINSEKQRQEPNDFSFNIIHES